MDPSFIDLSFCSHARSEREPVSGRDLADMTSRLGAHAFSSQPEMESLSQTRIFGPTLFEKRLAQAPVFFFELQTLRNAILRCICAFPPWEAVLENDP